ncbi:MFS transporter [Pelagibius litoralis]|uniref:MFS transporter n=1 Tax=Pelagibius litoralis TaxID=374515 RepID=A0A967K963_9PROT|nr:MFS transporter [Pelagibius litoralis]NIA70843.1 MFS transporter [Pelagibius litoralis]
MTTLLSFAALFASIFLVQMGSGSLGPLDALSGSVLGFSTEEIGLLGSAHFLGFFLGCYVAPRLIGDIGHSRTFAAAAAIGAIGALLHPVLEGPLYWALLRVLTGLAIAAAYTVVESWLHAKTDNQNRGRVYGMFRVVDLVGGIGAQGFIAILEPASYVAYNIVAMFCCICLLPLALTQRAAPKTPTAPRLQPIRALLLSPSAIAGIVVAGVTSAGFRMVGPIYGVENALTQGQIAIFLASGMLGGVAAQYPVGWIADKTDRRLVLLGLSGFAAASCLGIAYLVTPGDATAIFLAAFLFGTTAFPIYSVSAAYANDFAEPDFVVELNAALIFFFSLGAIVSPAISAWLIALAGANALFLFMAVTHLLLVAFTLYRMTRRRGAEPREPYRYLPRTSMILGRMFKAGNGGNANRED